MGAGPVPQAGAAAEAETLCGMGQSLPGSGLFAVGEAAKGVDSFVEALENDLCPGPSALQLLQAGADEAMEEGAGSALDAMGREVPSVHHEGAVIRGMIVPSGHDDSTTLSIFLFLKICGQNINYAHTMLRSNSYVR